MIWTTVIAICNKHIFRSSSFCKISVFVHKKGGFILKGLNKDEASKAQCHIDTLRRSRRRLWFCSKFIMKNDGNLSVSLSAQRAFLLKERSGRMGQCSQCQVLSSFRVSALAQSSNPHVTHGGGWSGCSCFVHPRRDAVGETLYNPVSLPCYLGTNPRRGYSQQASFSQQRHPFCLFPSTREGLPGMAACSWCFAHPRFGRQPGCCALTPSWRRPEVCAPCCEGTSVRL